MREIKNNSTEHIPFSKNLIVQFLIVTMITSVAAFSTNHFISIKFPEWVMSGGQVGEYWDEHVNAAFTDLQKKVTENRWACDEVIESTQHRLSTDNIVFFFEELPFLDLNDPKQQEYIQNNEVFVLHCADGNLISSSYTLGGHLADFLRVVGMVSGTIIACLVLFSYVLYLVHRINKLYRQVLYSRNMDVNQSVYLKGQDQLARLAQNIEGMRITLLELLENEKETQKSQIQLMATLSHDIRTPLTKLMGYTEILLYRKYADQQEQERCTKYIQETVQRLKAMTDDLLNCALVNGHLIHDDRQIVNGPEFLTQMLYEGFSDLEDAGFSISLPNLNGFYVLNICISDFQRICDNLSSNILKYASIDHPIVIEAADDPNVICLSISNHKTAARKSTPRHEIGLVSVRELVKKLEGSIDIVDKKETFSVCISIPKVNRPEN